MNENIISEKAKEDLLKLAKRISKLRTNLFISTTTLTPINYMDEMEKFFRSDSYNPVFVYKPAEKLSKEDEKAKIHNKLQKLEIPEDLKMQLEGVLEDLTLLEKTRKSVGTEEFAENAENLFSWGRDRLDLLMANTPKVQFALYTKHNLQDAEQIKARFEKVLKRYDITDLPIIIDDFSTHIISITQKGIKIGSKVKRYACNVDRLIVHEIESHALQIINVKRNDHKLAEMTRYSNMHLYTEGLAVYNEMATRKITPEAFETYYNRIRAVHMLSKSFREIFETLCRYLPPKNAYVLTYRVKRGMANTKDPGGFPKDASYLVGYHEIENLIKDGFSKKLLYATKSPILTTLLNKYNLVKTDGILTPKFR